MKKQSVMLVSVVLLAGCAAGGVSTSSSNTPTSIGTNIGESILKSAIDYECRARLNNNDTYKVVMMAMSSNQKANFENKLCGCVSEKAPQSITLAEVAQATLDPNARAQIVGTAVTKTLDACASEFVSGLI